MQKAAHAYLQTQVTTTTQGEVVVLLYDGALKFLNKAKELLAANDMAGKGNYISKTLDILNELEGSLNLEKGGDLATNLYSLYDFCSRRLVMANLKKSQEMIDDVIRVLTGLRSAYAEILSQPEAQAAAQEAAVNLRADGRPTRIQAGLAASGPAVPLPGAGARVRSLYAKASQQPGPPSDETRAPEAGENPAAQATESAESGQLPKASAGRDDGDTPAIPDMPLGGGFGTRLPGTGLYKKYTAMQK